MLQTNNVTNITIKNNYTSLEILTALKEKKEIDIVHIINKKVNELQCSDLKTIVIKINTEIVKNKLQSKKLKVNGRNVTERQNDIFEFVEQNKTNKKLLNDLFNINQTNTKD